MARDPHRDDSAKHAEILRLPLLCADEAQAVEFFEHARWGDKPSCPRCGDANVYQMTDRKTGGRNKRWLWRCRGCKKQYTVKTCSVMEQSAIPHRIWLYAWWLFASSKKGISALQLRRMLGVQYKTAWFMLHRIRRAVADNDPVANRIGGPDAVLEIDETYVGGKPRRKRKRAKQRHTGRGTKKVPVIAIVERGGSARYDILSGISGLEIGRMVLKHADPSSRLITDEFPSYNAVGAHFEGGHKRVKHKDGEYIDYRDRSIHTNSVEGLFSLLKRAIMGTFHVISAKHLAEYLVEFAFKYNTRADHDGQRLLTAIQAGEGKRVTLKELRAA